jgi:cytochrome d ubiquinol oxidase subunit II
MSGFFASIGMPEVVAGIALIALNAYALLGGADFGGGVWDLLASGPRREQQRALIAESIAPIWEANHVWLIIVVVMMFTGFPHAFETLSVVLHIPLTIMLVGIVARGSAFMFRSYGSRTVNVRDRWGAAFAIASVVTPFVLGMMIGAISSGAVARAFTATASPTSFVDVYVRPWAAPFPIAVGGFGLSIFAYLAAVYASVAAKDDALRDDFRARALWTALMVFVFAALALLTAYVEAPRVVAGVMGSPWAILLHIGTAAAAIVAIVALWRRRFGVARVAAAAQASLILWGWALSQYPYLVPETLTIRDAAAPVVTLRLLLVGLAGGAVVLLPSLRYMHRTFVARS